MKHHCLLPAIAIVATVASSSSVQAQTPALIPYQGRVQTGTPAADFNGTGQFKFALMQGTTATRLWVNNGTLTADPVNAVSLTVTNGLYSVMLGDTSLGASVMATIPRTVFANPDVRLRVWFNGTQLSPDQRLAPNGYVSSSLSLGDSLANTKLALWESSTAAYGLGIQGSQFRLHTAFPADRFSFLNGPNGAENLTILGNGNVGIGISSPATKLHIRQETAAIPTAILQGGDAEDETTSTRSGLAFSYYADDTSKHFITTTHSVTPSKNRMSFWLNNNTSLRTNDTPGNGTTNAMTLTGEGRVGIGTSAPNKGRLHVEGSQSTAAGLFGSVRYFNPQINGTVSNWGGGAVSIYASDNIVAAGIGLFSDERIKNIIADSDAAEDLDLLAKIRITNYTLKDSVAKGPARYKKVIAQQVEKVFPLAVSRSTGVVPDIYCRATIQDGWVRLDAGLRKGERVRLLSENSEGVYEVLEAKDGQFRTAFQPVDREIFVYGREVNDFRTVDYDAIAMLNVSATQELARRVEAKDAEVTALQEDCVALQRENAALKAELSAQASKDKSQDDQLAALAALMEKQSRAAAISTGVATVAGKR